MKPSVRRSSVSFPIVVAVFVGLAASRYWPASERYAAPDGAALMPTRLDDKAASELYLVPGGKYTQGDIAANGGVTAAERYRGFRAVHDLAPLPGEAICPITRTKANPRCTWVVNGETYQFCCPPCIDEFVLLAKDDPASIVAPKRYVQRR